MSSMDLLNPAEFFRSNYIRQLRQTISAYSTAMIALGEPLQNAIDAINEQPRPKKGEIIIDINFDQNQVTVLDNGIGFPPKTALLFLGGGEKDGKQTKGRVGVGIKVTLFSSQYFRLRSRTSDRVWMIEVEDAYKFEELDSLVIPDPLPDDPNPLNFRGTEVLYTFPSQADGKSMLDLFIHEVLATALPRGKESGFLRAIANLSAPFPSPIASLLSSYLRRYSYVGDVTNMLGLSSNYPQDGLDITVSITCSNPVDRFGPEEGALFEDTVSQTFNVYPSYMMVSDSLKWVPKGKKAPKLFKEKLGNGGKNLTRTDGFNLLEMRTPEEFESLLIDARGNLPEQIELYREKLFPCINGLALTIGRIPDFEQFLPGGSQRLVSCNGVVTSHDIDLTRGRNQEYVRCFDLILDVNAELNYGKTQLTNMHLVKWAKDYINDAYARVIQNAAASWVGRIPSPNDDPAEVFVGRPELGLEGYSIRKTPRDENDVIALFFEMIGRGLFPDYQVYGLSQRDTYDGRVAVRRLGDEATKPDPKDDTQLRVIEFKVSAAELIRDFDRYQKIAREVDILIAWDEGTYESQYYSVYDIAESQAYQATPTRVFPSVSKYIYDNKEGSEVQVILLKEIVESLQRDQAK